MARHRLMTNAKCGLFDNEHTVWQAIISTNIGDTMSDTDYETMIDYSDHSGLIISAARSGSWRRINPGHLGIVLTETTLDGGVRRVQGYSVDWDKAESICRRWVEDREISRNLLTESVNEAAL